MGELCVAENGMVQAFKALKAFSRHIEAKIQV